jgi:hypothetical protein
MKKMLYSAVACILLLIASASIVYSPEIPENQSMENTTINTDDFTYYWIIGQLPEQTHVYIYARDGADVTFGGTIGTPFVISVPSDQFVSYNVGDLGYTQTGTEWYYLEMSSDNSFMVNFDRAVWLKTGSNKYEWRHGDTIHNMPGAKLSTTYYFPFAGSGTGDDLIVMYAHEETQVTARALSKSGLVRTKTVTINGLYVSDILNVWFTNFDLVGYSVELTSDNPIAAVCFDELGWWPDVWRSGYYFSGAYYTELYNEFMHVHSSSSEYQNVFIPGANTFQYYDSEGSLVHTKAFSSESTSFIQFSSVGYGGSPDPYLVHIIASDPFVEHWMSPTEWSVDETLAFMGWNTSLATLHLYTDQDTHVSIYNGRDYSLVTEFDMAANTIYWDTLDIVGFEENQPFLMVVDSNTPIYQAVRIPNYLRPYPAEVAPPITNQPPTANAGSDQEVYEGDVVEFNGNGSFDPDGNITFCHWDFDSYVDSDGDGDTSNDVDAEGLTPTHIYGDNGIYVVTLTVIDNQNLSASDTCNITVLNVKPDVNIESAYMEVEIGLRVAGRKYNNVSMALYEDGNIMGQVSVERIPGSPNEQMAWINCTLDITKTHSANVTYEPEDPPNIGGNPVWIYIKFENSSIEKIHHTFNVQQSKKKDSEHWNHVEPWEVDLNPHLIGHPYDVTYQVTDPGSDDEVLNFTYCSQNVIITYLNNPPNPDPYPSPEVNPVNITDTTNVIYEGPGNLLLTVVDDDGGTDVDTLILS